MIALLLLAMQLPPPPAVAPRPLVTSESTAYVDLIVFNQFDRLNDNGTTTTAWYVSFWSFTPRPPGFPFAPRAWVHRGWCRMPDCRFMSGGQPWPIAVRHAPSKTTVFAPALWYIQSDYDFEYRNRTLMGRQVLWSN